MSLAFVVCDTCQGSGWQGSQPHAHVNPCTRCHGRGRLLDPKGLEAAARIIMNREYPLSLRALETTMPAIAAATWAYVDATEGSDR